MPLFCFFFDDKNIFKLQHHSSQRWERYDAAEMLLCGIKSPSFLSVPASSSLSHATLYFHFYSALKNDLKMPDFAFEMKVN